MALMLAAAYLLENRRDPQPLAMPVPVEGGEAASRTFRVDQPHPYLVTLQADPVLPASQLRCLLGVRETVEGTCGTTRSAVDLEWTVFAEGVAVAKGDSTKSQGGWAFSRLLGEFSGKPDQDYTLLVHVRRNVESLREANLRLVVRLHPLYTKGETITAELLRLGAMILTIPASGWLAIVWLRRKGTRLAAGRAPGICMLVAAALGGAAGCVPSPHRVERVPGIRGVLTANAVPVPDAAVLIAQNSNRENPCEGASVQGHTNERGEFSVARRTRIDLFYSFLNPPHVLGQITNLCFEPAGRPRFLAAEIVARTDKANTVELTCDQALVNSRSPSGLPQLCQRDGSTPK